MVTMHSVDINGHLNMHVFSNSHLNMHSVDINGHLNMHSVDFNGHLNMHVFSNIAILTCIQWILMVT